MARVWDQYLTDQDKAHVAAMPKTPVGFGERPAVLMIDNYRQVIGDRPQPLLEAIDEWPSSTGLAGWRALESIERLLTAARGAGLPVAHVTGLREEDSGIPNLSAFLKGRPSGEMSVEERQRAERWRDPGRYEIVEQAAPVTGEVVLAKAAPSAFFDTPLLSHLNGLGVDTLIVGGEATSGCVRASVVDAASYRFRTIVVEECVYDRHEAAHAINLFDMDMKYADVLPLDRVLEQIAEADRPA